MRRWIVVLVVALIAAVGTAVVVSVLVSESAQGPEEPVLPADVLREPERYLGREVRISDQVQTVRTPFFTIGGDESGDRLLVLQGRRDPLIVTPNDALAVRGVVRRFDPQAFVRDYGRSFAAFDDLEGRLVVVAENIDAGVPDDGTAPA